MVVKANTKLKKIGGAAYLLIPKDVLTDSVFPFKFGNNLSVEIKDKELIILNESVKEKLEREKK